MFTIFKANVARSVALSDVAVLLMQKCEAWYSASQARKAAAAVSQYCCVAGSSIVVCGARRLASWTGACGFAAVVSGLRWARMLLFVAFKSARAEAAA